MLDYPDIVSQHLNILRLGYGIHTWFGDDADWIEVSGVLLPPGYGHAITEVLIRLPSDYPISPPGLERASSFVRPWLRYMGRELDDVHTTVTPGFGDWAWFCFERIDWDMHVDDLVTFLEIIRTSLTEPPTH